MSQGVSLFLQRLLGDQSPDDASGAIEVATRLQQRRQLFEDRKELEAELLAAGDDPVLVAVLGQEPFAVEVDRLRVLVQVACATCGCDGRPKGVDVDPEPFARKP